MVLPQRAETMGPLYRYGECGGSVFFLFCALIVCFFSRLFVIQDEIVSAVFAIPCRSAEPSPFLIPAGQVYGST